MQLLYRALAVLSIGLPVAGLAMVAMCFQDRPLVTRDQLATSQELERAKRVVWVQDPAKAGPGGLQSVTIDARDVDLMVNYLANRYVHGAGDRRRLSLGRRPAPAGDDGSRQGHGQGH